MISEQTKADIRKYRKNMEIGGATLIIMGVWSVLRFIITFLLGTDDIAEMLETSPEDFESYKWIYICMIVLIYTVFFFIYYRAGVNSIRFARGRSGSKRHLVPVTVILILTVLCVPLYFASGFSVENIDTVIASLGIDLTTCFILADIIYCSVRLDNIRKETQVNITEL